MLELLAVALFSINSVPFQCGSGGALEEEVEAGAYEGYSPIKPTDKIVVANDMANAEAPMILNVFVREDDKSWRGISLGEANHLVKDFIARNGDHIVVATTQPGGTFSKPGHDFYGATLTSAGVLKACFRIPFPKQTNPKSVHFDSIGYGRGGALVFRFHRGNLGKQTTGTRYSLTSSDDGRSWKSIPVLR